MVIGTIAYKELKASNLKQLSGIISLLKKHPEYESRWLKQMNNMKLNAEEQALYLFMQAARWPDDARQGDYDHPYGFIACFKRLHHSSEQIIAPCQEPLPGTHGDGSLE